MSLQEARSAGGGWEGGPCLRTQPGACAQTVHFTCDLQPRALYEQNGYELVGQVDPFEGGLGFSLATRVGDLVYTSGMVGVDADFNVPANPADEFRQVFANLAGVLEAMGTSLDHIVDSTNFFAGDITAVYPAFEEVRKEVFGGRLPASTSIEVARLLDPRFHVEVKLVAAVPATE